MLDPFAQLFQHCWDHVRALNMDYKDCILPIMYRRSQHCWKFLYPFAHPTANTDATTPNHAGPTMFRVVASEGQGSLHLPRSWLFGITQTSNLIIQSGQTANYSSCLKNTSTCRNCLSVGCLKCLQFHDWFRLHWILLTIFQLPMIHSVCPPNFA